MLEGHLEGDEEGETMRLEAEKLSFQYDNGNRTILNNLSLYLDSSERLGLTAPSGFGKTTCCKILAGYEKPDKGDVLIDGVPLSSYKNYCPVQMIWQHPELVVNPRLKMKEVLNEGDHLEQCVIDGLRIEVDWMERYPGELSGGELQRFCIARAMGDRTKFLMADEISTMLDLITQSQIWSFLLEETKRRGIGLLVVSHSEGLLDKVCTRILDLREESC